VEAVDILPIDCAYETALGRFPSQFDAERFDAERTPRPASERP
jgi:hypothetical protein